MSKTTKKESVKLGRPKKDAAELRHNNISVWLDDAQKDRIKRAAALDGDTPGRWLAKLGDKTAKQSLESRGLSPA